MLEYSIYSVISPEGCAAILWKSAEKAGDAAEALGLTSARLLELRLVDQVIPEPLGGAHRDIGETAARLKATLLENIAALKKIPVPQLIDQRYDRLMRYGQFGRG
jgi:acetyl-CoA carboxylase carboxyl transferase subunit alpha